MKIKKFIEIRKLEIKYHDGLINVELKGPEYQLKQRYEALKNEYISTMGKMRNLEDEIEQLKGILLKEGITFTKLVTKPEEYDF